MSFATWCLAGGSVLLASGLAPLLRPASTTAPEIAKKAVLFAVSAGALLVVVGAVASLG
jgi:hypothetical protein